MVKVALIPTPRIGMGSWEFGKWEMGNGKKCAANALKAMISKDVLIYFFFLSLL
jgi:hypothetical protein